MFDFSIGSLIISLLSIVLLLLLWFVVNRVSVRANEQIRLLHEVVEQQRRQTELLAALLANVSGTVVEDDTHDDLALSFRDVIPER